MKLYKQSLYQKNAHWYDVYRRRITTESSWRRGYFNSVSVKFEAGSTFEPVAVIRRSLSIATGVFLEHSQRDGEEWLNTWYYIENAAHQGLKRNHAQVKGVNGKWDFYARSPKNNNFLSYDHIIGDLYSITAKGGRRTLLLTIYIH
ncbi:hypothetical protein BDF22DRAFT_653980 [Syncephalis plumigaleata]|nr:hypothetical protein BDF22DRAFT_653980 [Syncephalis plumigaleata]